MEFPLPRLDRAPRHLRIRSSSTDHWHRSPTHSDCAMPRSTLHPPRVGMPHHRRRRVRIPPRVDRRRSRVTSRMPTPSTHSRDLHRQRSHDSSCLLHWMVGCSLIRSHRHVRLRRVPTARPTPTGRTKTTRRMRVGTTNRASVLQPRSHLRGRMIGSTASQRPSQPRVARRRQILQGTTSNSSRALARRSTRCALCRVRAHPLEGSHCRVA